MLSLAVEKSASGSAAAGTPCESPRDAESLESDTACLGHAVQSLLKGLSAPEPICCQIDCPPDLERLAGDAYRRGRLRIA